jgi:hypothetical protein
VTELEELDDVGVIQASERDGFLLESTRLVQAVGVQ